MPAPCILNTAARLARTSATHRAPAFVPVRRLHESNPEPTHYDTLSLPPTASAIEIKKRFYELSKTHHPDRNRHDPHASQKFSRITGAYSILSNPETRRRYDRDQLPRHHPHSPSHPSHRGPVGSRPASGLSRRRTTAKGPPPSWFRSGRYGGGQNNSWYGAGVGGTGGGAREKTYGPGERPGAAGPGEHANAGAGGTNWGPMGAAGPGVKGFHFGRKREYHEREEVRRAAKQAKASGNAPLVDMSTFWSALSIAAVIGGTVWGTWWVRDRPVAVEMEERRREGRRK